MKKRYSVILYSLLALIFILYSCEFGAKDVGLDQSFEMTEEYEFYFRAGAGKYKKLPSTIDLKKIIGETKIVSDINIEANIIDFKIKPTKISWESNNYKYTVEGYEISLTSLIHLSKNNKSGKHNLYAHFKNLYELGKYLGVSVVFVSKPKSGGCSCSDKHTALSTESKIIYHTISVHESTGSKLLMQTIKFIGTIIIVVIIIAAIIIGIMSDS